jgi:hypothetical protein
MELLPPVGWADVATKHDLLQLESRMDVRFENLELKMDSRLESLETRIGSRFEKLETSMEGLEHRMTAKIERDLRSVLVTMMSLFVTGFLAVVLAVTLG